MSKFQLRCSCVLCHTETTIQSLTSHIKKCSAVPSNVCEHCSTPTNNPMFCSRSCRQKVLNTRRPKKQKRSKVSIFDQNIQRFESGLICTRPTLRRHLSRTRGYQCAVCALSVWNDKDITLIVDHVDGNAGDNSPSNLQLLCPNCNSQSPTFGGRNKGYGRKSRGLSMS